MGKGAAGLPLDDRRRPLRVAEQARGHGHPGARLQHLAAQVLVVVRAGVLVLVLMLVWVLVRMLVLMLVLVWVRVRMLVRVRVRRRRRVPGHLGRWRVGPQHHVGCWLVDRWRRGRVLHVLLLLSSIGLLLRRLLAARWRLQLDQVANRRRLPVVL